MEHTLSTNHYLRFVEGEIMKDDGLTVIFTSPSYDLCKNDVRLAVKNGKKKDVLYPVRDVENNAAIFDLTPFVFAGTLEIAVHIIVGGKTRRKWEFFPVIVNELDESHEAFDWLEDIRRRLEAVEEKTQVIM
jgi:hypothetical protein